VHLIASPRCPCERGPWPAGARKSRQRLLPTIHLFHIAGAAGGGGAAKSPRPKLKYAVYYSSAFTWRLPSTRVQLIEEGAIGRGSGLWAHPA